MIDKLPPEAESGQHMPDLVSAEGLAGKPEAYPTVFLAELSTFITGPFVEFSNMANIPAELWTNDYVVRLQAILNSLRTVLQYNKADKLFRFTQSRPPPLTLLADTELKKQLQLIRATWTNIDSAANIIVEYSTSISPEEVAEHMRVIREELPKLAQSLRKFFVSDSPEK